MIDRSEVLRLSERYVCPDRVRFLTSAGVDIVMGERSGYRFRDIDGREFIDVHLNGGVFNLGHRNPELVDTLVMAVTELDIGNHHFPSVERAQLAEQLVSLSPESLRYSVFASGGGEAIDLAVKSARRATGRRGVVSLTAGYHGHTGLALAAGDERAASAFLSDGREFTHVPFGDLDAMAAAVGPDTAAVLVETVPATSGFPVPPDGYLTGVAEIAAAAGALLIADEVQTGLGRSGALWAVDRFGVRPDILVTGKGLSGGLYPIAATVLGERAGAWLESDGWGHVSTFGGAELGCRVARRVLDITTRAETVARVAALVDLFAAGLGGLAERHAGWLVEVRQTGLVVGLRFAHEQGGLLMTRACADSGLWAIFAGFDTSVLQVKPGLLMDDDTAHEVLQRLDAAMERAAAWAS